MAANPGPPDLEIVTEAGRAQALLDPLRLRLLGLAQRPISAADMAARLRMPRQRVNYHVRRLADRGFLRRAGRQRKRNMVEQLYVAVARRFLLAPELLEPVAADWREVADTASGSYLLALASRVQADVLRASRAAEAEGRRLTTLSLKSQFRFETVERRADFARAIREAVVEAIARHTVPDEAAGSPARGRAAAGLPYRLVLSCYPLESEPGG
ncbi:MAG TPA: helix-turn-helix domain-containing protein [Thermoanaerobaculia bacterium]